MAVPAQPPEDDDNDVGAASGDRGPEGYDEARLDDHHAALRKGGDADDGGEHYDDYDDDDVDADEIVAVDADDYDPDAEAEALAAAQAAAEASGPPDPRDVVYLQLRGRRRFCVPSAVLGRVPDSLLVALFPSGLVPFFPAPSPPPPPPPSDAAGKAADNDDDVDEDAATAATPLPALDALQEPETPFDPPHDNRQPPASPLPEAPAPQSNPYVGPPGNGEAPDAFASTSAALWSSTAAAGRSPTADYDHDLLRPFFDPESPILELDYVDDLKFVESDLDPGLFSYVVDCIRRLLIENERRRIRMIGPSPASGLERVATGSSTGELAETCSSGSLADIELHHPDHFHKAMQEYSAEQAQPALATILGDPGTESSADLDELTSRPVESILVLREETEFFVIPRDSTASSIRSGSTGPPPSSAPHVPTASATARPSTGDRPALHPFLSHANNNSHNSNRNHHRSDSGIDSAANDCGGLLNPSRAAESSTPGARSRRRNRRHHRSRSAASSRLSHDHPSTGSSSCPALPPAATTAVAAPATPAPAPPTPAPLGSASARSASRTWSDRDDSADLTAALKRYCGAFLARRTLVGDAFSFAEPTDLAAATAPVPQPPVLAAALPADPVSVSSSSCPPFSPATTATAPVAPSSPLQHAHMMEAIAALTAGGFDRAASTWGFRDYDDVQAKLLSVAVLPMRPPPPPSIYANPLAPAAAPSPLPPTPPPLPPRGAAEDGNDQAGSDGDGDLEALAAAAAAAAIMTQAAPDPLLDDDPAGGGGEDRPPPAFSLDLLISHMRARRPVRKCWWEQMRLRVDVADLADLAAAAAATAGSLPAAAAVVPATPASPETPPLPLDPLPPLMPPPAPAPAAVAAEPTAEPAAVLSPPPPPRFGRRGARASQQQQQQQQQQQRPRRPTSQWAALLLGGRPAASQPPGVPAATDADITATAAGRRRRSAAAWKRRPSAPATPASSSASAAAAAAVAEAATAAAAAGAPPPLSSSSPQPPTPAGAAHAPARQLLDVSVWVRRVWLVEFVAL